MVKANNLKLQNFLTEVTLKVLQMQEYKEISLLNTFTNMRTLLENENLERNVVGGWRYLYTEVELKQIIYEEAVSHSLPVVKNVILRLCGRYFVGYITKCTRPE